MNIYKFKVKRTKTPLNQFRNSFPRTKALNYPLSNPLKAGFMVEEAKTHKNRWDRDDRNNEYFTKSLSANC